MDRKRSSRLGPGDQDQRRAERDERGRQQQEHDRLQLVRPRVEELPDQAGHGRVPAGGEDAAVAPVVVLVGRVEMRDDHPDGQERPGETPDQEDLARLDAPPAVGIRGRDSSVLSGGRVGGVPGSGQVCGVVGGGWVSEGIRADGLAGGRAHAGDGQVQADGGHRETLILLDEDQRERPPDRSLDAAADQRGQGEGQQRDGEGDLVEIEAGHLLQAPGEPVRDRDGPARADPGAPEFLPRGLADTEDGERGQQRLHGH